MKKIIVLLTALLLISCRTVDINSAPDMHTSPNLTTNEIKTAIVQTINNATPTPKLDLAKTIMVRQVDGFSMNPLHATTTNYWFVEEVGDDYVIVGFDNGKHYFAVKYLIGNGLIKREIVNSRNLRQTNAAIHKNVFVWIHQIDVSIKRTMSSIMTNKQIYNNT